MTVRLRLVWSAEPSTDVLLWAFWSLPLRLWLQHLLWLRGPAQKFDNGLTDPENVA